MMKGSGLVVGLLAAAVGFLIFAIIYTGVFDSSRNKSSSKYTCIKCGSSNVHASVHNSTGFGSQNFRCNDCGFGWTEFDNGLVTW